jgi:hypothetical protein
VAYVVGLGLEGHEFAGDGTCNATVEDLRSKEDALQQSAIEGKWIREPPNTWTLYSNQGARLKRLEFDFDGHLGGNRVTLYDLPLDGETTWITILAPAGRAGNQ